MFRVALVALVAAILFGFLAMIPAIGQFFALVATISIVITVVAFLGGLIKILFFWF